MRFLWTRDELITRKNLHKEKRRNTKYLMEKKQLFTNTYLYQSIELKGENDGQA